MCNRIRSQQSLKIPIRSPDKKPPLPSFLLMWILLPGNATCIPQCSSAAIYMHWTCMSGSHGRGVHVVWSGWKRLRKRTNVDLVWKRAEIWTVKLCSLECNKSVTGSLTLYLYWNLTRDCGFQTGRSKRVSLPFSLQSLFNVETIGNGKVF